MKFKAGDKFEVTSYRKSEDSHVVKNLRSGVSISVDMYLDGTFDETNAPDEKEAWYQSRELLVGKTVEIEALLPIMYAALNVKIVK